MEQKWQMQGGGTLTLSQEGNRVRLEAERPEDSQGLYKVWLTGAQGGRLLLGTLAPERGALRLRRTLSVGELERAGCWPPQGAQAPLAFPFSASERWYREQHPEQLVRDPVLKKQLKGPILCRKERDGFSLAAPFRTGAPAPLEPLFCLARVERLEGRLHMVWSFDREGAPRQPNKRNMDGKD